MDLTRRRWAGVYFRRSANARDLCSPITAIDYSLYGFDTSCIKCDTSDSARPVRPSSTHA
jgi:hypothetical protein